MSVYAKKLIRRWQKGEEKENAFMLSLFLYHSRIEYLIQLSKAHFLIFEFVSYTNKYTHTQRDINNYDDM
jgi:hypothetical protein